MELDRIDRLCVYVDDKSRYSSSLYHKPGKPRVIKPRAQKRGKVIILFKRDDYGSRN